MQSKMEVFSGFESADEAFKMFLFLKRYKNRTDQLNAINKELMSLTAVVGPDRVTREQAAEVCRTTYAAIADAEVHRLMHYFGELKLYFLCNFSCVHASVY